MATWATICRLMEKYADRTTEKTYEESIKDIILENGLGWCSSQIESQKSLQLGSTERLIPDIVVSTDGRTSFVVEVKKSDHVRTQANIDQLVSYMKQLEVPVGIYVGNKVEVYYKSIGDGTEPVCVMSLNFSDATPQGDDFVKLFSAAGFSVANIVSYLAEQKQAERFRKNVKSLIENMTSIAFCERLRMLILEYYESNGSTHAEIQEALSQVSITVNELVVNSVEYGEVSGEQQNSIRNYHRTMQLSRKGTRRNGGAAQRYAFNLIKQILGKNSSLTFRQLYSIFNRRNFIEDINNVKDESRWCMADEDMFMSIDGVGFVVSNQWGFYNTCKPKMDYLRSIAEQYGIDTTFGE